MRNWTKAVCALASVAMLAGTGACGGSRGSVAGGGGQVPKTPLR